MKVNIKSAFSKTDRVGLDCSCDEPLTEQYHKDSCDINRLVDRAIQLNQLQQPPEYLKEVIEVPSIDYQQAMEKMVKVNQVFDGLPSEVRKRFSNKPEQFLDFVSDKNNVQEMIELGLAEKVPPREPTMREQMAGALKDHENSKGNPKGDPEK